MTSIDLFELSIPIHFLPSFSAAANVPPLPAKKSKTIEFGLEDCFIIISNISAFFSVGYIGFCGSLYVHTS